ncbi:MAG TPA: formimidoylglutamate deiminase, partial [Haliangium sp.]|nr:formimidoylglutamate deiminase [Haliangium sp.]
YADRAAMAMAVVEAAREIGIGLTLLPVLYMTSGFGGAPPKPAQRRFVHTSEGFAALLADLHGRLDRDPQLRLGMAPHSLRAVTPAALLRALSDLDAMDRNAGDAGAPIHVHVAEQQQEVADCLAWSGQRPVAWLLEHAPVGPRWCLVHATHVTPDETSALAASGAVAGLCPTTEANLGDGLFPLAAYLDVGGRLGIGSDSHVSVNPIAELRWLEYGQRLVTRSRNVAASQAERSTGARLYRAALAGGAQALGRPVGAIAPGQRADFIVVDDQHPLLYGRGGDLLLDSLVFSGDENPIRDVMIGGHWVVRDGAHPAAGHVRSRFRRTMDRLLA